MYFLDIGFNLGVERGKLLMDHDLRGQLLQNMMGRGKKFKALMTLAHFTWYELNLGMPLFTKVAVFLTLFKRGGGGSNPY